MNKFLDILARFVIVVAGAAVVGLFGVMFYLHPHMILPGIGGITGVVLLVWAMDRVC